MTAIPAGARFAPLALLALATLAATCDRDQDRPEGPLTIETRTLPPATVGAPYALTFEASGGSGAYSWTAHGALPPGLTLTPDSGTLVGTPATAGQYSFSVQASDGRVTARRMVALTVATGGPLEILTGELPPATARTSYSQPLQAAGGTPPYVWSLASGALPAGLVLDAGSGALAGTVGESGTHAFTLRVRDAAGAVGTRPLELHVNPPPAITTGALRLGTLGRTYADTLRAAGGSPPLVWIVTTGSLPAGLALDAARGIVSGTPTTAGVSAFTARVADAAGAGATRPYTITVTALLTSPSVVLPTLTVDRPVSLTLPVIGGTAPYAWRVVRGTPPTGLTVDASGALVGTPTVAGTFDFTAQVTDAASMVTTRPVRLIVVPVPSIVTTVLPAGRVRRAYRQAIRRSGGTTPFVWSLAAGALPAGLALDAATGTITGTPTAADSAAFTVRVTDASGASASRQLRILVR